MRKKHYEKPATEVVMLQQQSPLLSGSNLDAKRNDYGTASSSEGSLWNGL